MGSEMQAGIGNKLGMRSAKRQGGGRGRQCLERSDKREEAKSCGLEVGKGSVCLENLR